MTKRKLFIALGMLCLVALAGCGGQGNPQVVVFPAGQTGQGVFAINKIEVLSDVAPAGGQRTRELMLNDTIHLTVYGDISLANVKTLYELVENILPHPGGMKQPVLSVNGSDTAASVVSGTSDGPLSGGGDFRDYVKSSNGTWQLTGSGLWIS